MVSDGLYPRAALPPWEMPPWENVPGIHWIGSWVDPRAGLDSVEKWKLWPLPELKLRALGRRACGE
jgi:hypothetical protein